MNAAVENLQDELNRQGERERSMFGKVLTAGADQLTSPSKSSISLIRSQPEFMEIFALPMFAMLASVFPKCMPVYERALSIYILHVRKK